MLKNDSKQYPLNLKSGQMKALQDFAKKHNMTLAEAIRRGINLLIKYREP